MVTITSPVNGSELNFDGFTGEFTIDNPSGGELYHYCRVDDLTTSDDDGETKYCEARRSSPGWPRITCMNSA